MVGAVVGHEVIALALRAQRLLLERVRRVPRDRHEIDGASGEDAEVDARAVARRAVLIHLTRGLVLQLLLLGLREERL